MSATTISNILSLAAQRRLQENTDAVSRGLERMASGMRINRAADDAAGLAIASSLEAGTRIYSQAIRNVNDGLSMLAIAEGALHEMNAILMRQRELAAQAANGTYSAVQRRSLNQEANALVDEFNRIVQSVEFNGQRLFDGNNHQVVLQAGKDSEAMLAIDIGGALIRTVGDGTFTQGTSFATGAHPTSITGGDYNHDGFVDLIMAEESGDSIGLLLGNGDGTFNARLSFAGNNPLMLETVDVDRDGNLDVVAILQSQGLGIFLGNGNGTFRRRSAYSAAGTDSRSLSLADFNGDGSVDAVTANFVTGTASIFLANGNGTFRAQQSYVAGPSARGVTTGDFNGDGRPDFAISDSTATVHVYLGNGDGSFRAGPNAAGWAGTGYMRTADMNADGYTDLITRGDTAGVGVLLGNGDGSFSARSVFRTSSSPFSIDVADLNGDGRLDIVTASALSPNMSILIGNGNGTFQGAPSIGTYGLSHSARPIDLNGDGAPEIVTTHTDIDTLSIFNPGLNTVATMPYLNISSPGGAYDAMGVIDTTIDRVMQQLGSIGASQSRLEVTVRNLAAARENFAAAKSRITDADMASESAMLMKNQILQQAAAAVLAQANQQPRLVVQLLT